MKGKLSAGVREFGPGAHRLLCYLTAILVATHLPAAGSDNLKNFFYLHNPPKPFGEGHELAQDLQARSEFLSQYQNEDRPAEEIQVVARDVIAGLTQKAALGRLSYFDLSDLGFAHQLMTDFHAAEVAFMAAAGQAPSTQKKVSSLLAAAASAHFRGNHTQAGRIANLANRYSPQSRPIAALRFAYWNLAQDRLEQEIAEDNMRRINLNLEGSPVFDPGTIAVIVVLSGTVVSLYAIHRAEDIRGEHVVEIIQSINRTIQLAIAPMVPLAQQP